jgi:hypothetical protein
MNLTDAERKEREELRNRILGPLNTLDDVVAARKALSKWLKKHPDDHQILGEGESLVMLESAMRRLDKLYRRK